MNKNYSYVFAASAAFWFVGASTQAAEIEEVIVTSERLEESIPLDLSRYGNQVQIVTGEEILERGFTDVTQTLQMMVPGLHIAPKNGPFDYMTASLQGSRVQDILWLIDGVRITNRLYNGTSPLDTIPAHMVERIEVLKGGQGIFYGTQSVGGVINIVTKGFSNEMDGAVGTGVNSNDGFNVNAYLRGAAGDHQFVLYGSKDDADGYTPYRSEDIQPSSTDHERGYEVNTFGLKYALNVGDNSRLSLQYQFTDNELDYARPFLNNHTVNDREESIVTAKFDQRINDNIELFVKAYRHYWDTEYTRIYNELDGSGNLTGGLVVRNNKAYWGYEDYGYNAMAKMDFGGGLEYIIGFDQQNFSGEDEVWRIGDQEERVNAPFVQVRTTDELFASTMLALGVRNNSASSMEDSTVWNITGKHEFTDNLYVQGNIGTSFRMPDAEALFLNEYYDDDNNGVPDGGYFAIGNPNLEPEESENINLSLGGNFAKTGFELTYFTRDITNYIDSYVSITIAGVDGETFVNSDDEVNIDGVELNVSTSLTDSISLQANFTRTKAQFNGEGPQLIGIPTREVKLRADYRLPNSPMGLSLSTDLVGDINGRRGVDRGTYALTDISGYYFAGARQQHKFVLRLENITDKEYATRIDVGTEDATGASYNYWNLGMSRTVHLNYTYQF